MGPTYTPATGSAQQNGQPHPPGGDPAYLEIIRLGPDVVPILIDELRRDPDWWFGSLRQITGHNPAPPDAAGQLGQLAQARIDWWDRSHGR